MSQGARRAAAGRGAASVEVPGSLRLIADAEVFHSWLRDHPLTSPTSPRELDVGPLPPAVAAALAVQLGAEVSIAVRAWTPAGGSLTLGAALGDLASSVACEGIPPPQPVAAEDAAARLWQQPEGLLDRLGGAVEVAMFPAGQLAAEVLRGVPANPSALTAPLATGLQVAIAGPDDAVACWQETLLATAGRWRRVLPPHLAHLVEDADSPAEGVLLDPSPRTLQAFAADLHHVLAGCLERAWLDPDPP